MRRLLNPLQWNFGPRTTATLLAWAVVPAALVFYSVLRSLETGAAQLGLKPEQVSFLTGGMLRGLVWVAVPTLVVCISAAVLFAWVVVQPLWRLRKAMEEIAHGNLAEGPVPVRSMDEVGQITRSFNGMTASLQAMVRDMAVVAAELDRAGVQLQESARHTSQATDASQRQIELVRVTTEGQASKATDGARATEELKHASEQVAVAAESQAREVEKAAMTVQQVAAAIQQVAAGAGVVSDAAGHTRTAADAGSKAVEAVVSGMGRVSDSVLTAAGQVQSLSDNLMHVNEILDLISEIADQTDLLALNAAIEAARVGEHGRGFAVVAGEVRRLAERSRRAASDIADRLTDLRDHARGVVDTMEAGTHEVEHGQLLAQEAGSSLVRILQAVAETQEQVESISAAAEEISAASTEVVEVTHRLSALAEENAATAEEMLAGAKSVYGMIGDVEQGAYNNQNSAAALATAAVQVRSSVADMAASASQVAATSARLRDQVAKFRLG